MKPKICNVCKIKLDKTNRYKGQTNMLCKKHFSESLVEYRKGKGRKWCERYFSSEKGKAGWNKACKKAMVKYPEKWRARYLLREAVRKGLIKKLPCEVCHKLPSQGHHEDYNFPLSVIWYCTFHHRERHKEIINIP